MQPDRELLNLYATDGDEPAFAEVVRRHVNLVYGSAVRLLNGDAALAEDVTQAVFTEMARNASMLAVRESPTGWLHTTTRYMASHAIRAEQRRRAHEQEASAMNTQNAAQEISWTQLRPLIDEAVGQLPEPDRNAVLLRFFEDKSHGEVGASLGLSENAARMRVERAVDKLRAYFARHGVTTTAALLASTLGAHAANSTLREAFISTVAGKSLLGVAGGNGAGTTLAAATLRKSGGPKMLAVLAGLGGVAIAATLVIAQTNKSRPAPEIVQVTAAAQPSALKLDVDTSKVTLSPVAMLGPVAVTVAITGASMATTDSASGMLDTTGQDSGSPVRREPEPQPTVTDSAATSGGNPGPEALTTEPRPVLAMPSFPPPMVHGTGIVNWPWVQSPGSEVSLGIGPLSGRTKAQGNNTPFYYQVSGPVLVDASGALRGKFITAIAEGGGRKLALCTDGTLVGWGMIDASLHSPLNLPNLSYPRDNGKNSTFLWPVVLNTNALRGRKIVAIAAGMYCCMALCGDGTVYEWGQHATGFPQGVARPTVHLPPSDQELKALATVGKFVLQPKELDHFTPKHIAGMVTPYGGILFSDPYSILGQAIIADDPVPMNFGALKGRKVVAISYDFRNDDAVVLCADGALVSWGAVVEYSSEGKKCASFGSGLPIQLNDRGAWKGRKIIAVSGHTVLCEDGVIYRWPSLLDGEAEAFAIEDPAGVLKGKTIAKISGEYALCTDGTVTRWGETIAWSTEAHNRLMQISTVQYMGQYLSGHYRGPIFNTAYLVGVNGRFENYEDHQSPPYGLPLYDAMASSKYPPGAPLGLKVNPMTSIPELVKPSSVFEGKKVVDIAAYPAGDHLLALAADGTIGSYKGAWPASLDLSFIPEGKSILAITPRMVLFGDKPKP